MESKVIRTDVGIDQETQEAYALFLFDEEQNWPMFMMENYIISLFQNPFVVYETLLVVQYQPREESKYTNSIDRDKIYLKRLDRGLGSDAKVILTFEDQGWTAFFRGHLTHFMHSFIIHALQPLMEEYFNEHFNIIEDVNPITLMASSTITGFVASPLELIRTRSSLPNLDSSFSQIQRRGSRFLVPFMRFILFTRKAMLDFGQLFILILILYQHCCPTRLLPY
jgi:hypothetical protein